MRAGFGVKVVAPAVCAAGAVALALGAGPSSGAARPLPRGCNLQYGGQTIGAAGGRRTTFSFQGLNAVPPDHRATDARITWGDGKSAPATAKRRSAPFAPGCYVTNFTARHTYPRVKRCANATCTKQYHVTIRYRDAQTNVKLALGLLHVIIGNSRKK